MNMSNLPHVSTLAIIYRSFLIYLYRKFLRIVCYKTSTFETNRPEKRLCLAIICFSMFQLHISLLQCLESALRKDYFSFSNNEGDK